MVKNQKADIRGAFRASDAGLKNRASPREGGEPRRVCEQGRKGIRTACGKLSWGPAEGWPGGPARK